MISSPYSEEDAVDPSVERTKPESQTLGGLFLRFLRFGCLAWGGPVAQIAMLKRELVEEERWIPLEQFNRVYAVYQVLPGPEAHELCVYFGTLARGRLGGLVAGLGFMLPGFVLMLALTWVYVRFGFASPALAAVFAGMQAGVIALIVRAVHRIGEHALIDRWAWIAAAAAAGASVTGVHFGIVLALAAIIYVCGAARRHVLATIALLAMLAVILAVATGLVGSGSVGANEVVGARRENVGLLELFGSGLRSGLLTFGGAYTVIPYLQHDAVVRGGWMTDQQFLDGIALGGVLPAPLIIFATFVGFLASSWAGAFVLTAGIFLPAFGFTMVGHELLERITHSPRMRVVLAGVTAGVVGLIAATTVQLAATALDRWPAVVIAAVCLTLLYVWKSKLAVPCALAVAAIAGYLSLQ